MRKSNNVALLGFCAAMMAFIANAGFSIAQILQIVGLLRYPSDAILIFGFSLGIACPFMLAILALHYVVPDEKKIWSHAALLFSVMYAVYVTLMYTVQLTVTIPHSLSGTPIDLLVDQPRSLLRAIDALGYLSMGFATLFAVPVFEKQGIQKWLRRFFLAHGLLNPVLLFVYFYPHFSNEILLLASPWIFTASGVTMLLALFFRQRIPMA